MFALERAACGSLANMTNADWSKSRAIGRTTLTVAAPACHAQRIANKASLRV